MKTLAGIVPARSGRIFFAGRDITRAPPHARAQLGLAYVPEDRQVFPDHSVEDNLLIAAKNGPDGRRDWTLPRIWETFPLLAKLRARDAGRLSGGEQQLLVIARALMGNPLALLLDEPSEGLAPIVVATISKVLRPCPAGSKPRDSGSLKSSIRASRSREAATFMMALRVSRQPSPVQREARSAPISRDAGTETTAKRPPPSAPFGQPSHRRAGPCPRRTRHGSPTDC